jgi:hypothetical protein
MPYIVKILSSFFSSRSFTLSNSTKGSLVTNIDLGFPQGSALSPFLWNVLLQDLRNLSFSFPFRFIAYADDIVLCSMDKDALSAHRKLQLMCDAVVVWGTSVKLSFNALKSVLMIFSSKRNLPPLPLLVDNVPVLLSNSCLYLGLTIDVKLSLNLHVSQKCTSAKNFFIPNPKMLSNVLGPIT